MSVVGSISDSSRALLDKIANNPKNKERLRSQSLDKDAYFKLMLEQLKHQDPMSPMDNNAMIAQMAQFSTMEQLGNMVKAQTDMNKTAQMTNDYLKVIAENSKNGDSAEKILAELQKMNKMLEEYLPAAEDSNKVNQLLEVLLAGINQPSVQDESGNSEDSGV